MKRILELDIMEIDDLYERYNRKKASRDLINYIIESLQHLSSKDELTIVINNHSKENEKCIPIIIDGLDEECDKSQQRHLKTNRLQIVYLIIGLLALSISTQISLEILREVVIICGWVLMWTIIELEIFNDVAERKRRKLIKKILSSKFIEK